MGEDQSPGQALSLIIDTHEAQHRPFGFLLVCLAHFSEGMLDGFAQYILPHLGVIEESSIFVEEYCLEFGRGLCHVGVIIRKVHCCD